MSKLPEGSIVCSLAPTCRIIADGRWIIRLENGTNVAKVANVGPVDAMRSIGDIYLHPKGHTYVGINWSRQLQTLADVAMAYAGIGG